MFSVTLEMRNWNNVALVYVGLPVTTARLPGTGRLTYACLAWLDSRLAIIS